MTYFLRAHWIMNVARPLGHARHFLKNRRRTSCGRYMSLPLVAKTETSQNPGVDDVFRTFRREPALVFDWDIPAPGKKLPTHQRDKTRAVDTENDGPNLDM